MFASRFLQRHKRVATIVGATTAAGVVASSTSGAHASAPAADAAPRSGSDAGAGTPPWGRQMQRENRALPFQRYAVADAVQRILPSVVKIEVSASRTDYAGNSGVFGFKSDPLIFASVGSGFVISGASTGGVEIVTNHHVVGEAIAMLSRKDVQVEIYVTTVGGMTWPATFKAGDERSDVALLNVESDGFSAPPAQLGDSDNVRAGEFVVAAGAPLTLGNSCSFGIISSVGRDLSVSHGEDVTGQDYLQSDIALNVGSSGGPLCDLDGRVVGVCSKKAGGEGVGFAIPVNYAMKIVTHLREHGKVLRPYLGLAVISLTKQVVDDIESDENYHMPDWLESEVKKSEGIPFSRGLLVHNISKRGPADVGGLRKGDVILAVDGVLTTSASQFLREMSFKVGQKVEVRYRAFSDGSFRITHLIPEALGS